ncbi:MAG: TIGR00266 family protein [Thermodesulfobacteriota bacterium]
MSHTVMEKYRKFAEDYNSGVARTTLCSKYNMRDEQFDAFLAFLKRKGFTLSPARSADFTSAHEIDFEILGDEMQFVEIELDPGETTIAEAGAMMYMDENIQMETIFGDGSTEHEGVMSKIFGAGKRVLTGESLFMTAFTNGGAAKHRVAFSAPYPGKIIPVPLGDFGGELICQKDAFLCAAKGVSVGIAFQKKLGTGFFGGEGFILQRLQGDGLAFVHAGGTINEKQLAPGAALKVDTGCLVAMEPTVNYDIQFVGGIKTAFFGGEGFFFATLRGPGRIWLQSMPFNRLADRLAGSASAGGSKIKINLGK